MQRPSNVAAMLSLLAFVSSVAVAQGPPPDAGRSAEMIHKHDLDGDGRLSDAEIRALRPKGSPMGPRERGKGPPRSAHGIAPDSGTLKNDARIQALLDEFDGDGDGILDLSEMAALRNALRNKSGGFRRVVWDGDRGGPEEPPDDVGGLEPPQPSGHGKTRPWRQDGENVKQERTDK